MNRDELPVFCKLLTKNIISYSAVSDLSGDAGVYRFDIEYGLSEG